MTVIRDSVVSNDSTLEHSTLFDYVDEEESELVPLAVPLLEGETKPPASITITTALDDDHLSTPPPKPPRGQSPSRRPIPEALTLVTPQVPPPLPPRSPQRIADLFLATTSSSSPLSAPPLGNPSGFSGMSLDDVRNVEQAWALAQTLPVDPEDPVRAIDPEVDIFLGYRPVQRDTTGFDTYDFYEELGAGYYFYSSRDIAWEIGRSTHWGNFEVVRAYIRPPYRRGYEGREKIRVYPGPPKTDSSSSVKRSNSFSFSRLISSMRDEPKYQIASILQSSFGQEILIADAPVGRGIQIKLGVRLESYIIRLNDEYNLDETGTPNGGWPVAVHEHTRTHGRLRSFVRRITSNSAMEAKA
ncbi:hypothetical protein BDF19DRAFT_436676 [Syncephalis fuscata]|nr:hypothetical protein BDF19DRAFT_436676 [Syncephalis fuscata]